MEGFLLQLFQSEGDSRVRHSLCDIIAQVSILDENWPGLYDFVIAACSQPTDVCVDGMYLLGEVGYNNESV